MPTENLMWYLIKVLKQMQQTPFKDFPNVTWMPSYLMN